MSLLDVTDLSVAFPTEDGLAGGPHPLLKRVPGVEQAREIVKNVLGERVGPDASDG